MISRVASRILAPLSSSLLGLALAAASLTPAQQECVQKASRHEKAGWVYLHLEGEPHDLGFQHGYLMAKEIKEGLRVSHFSWRYGTGMDWEWLTEKAGAMFTPHIDSQTLAELDGLVDGLAAAGLSVSRNDVIAYNGFIELDGYWWPQQLQKMKDGPTPPVRESCSSFVATGTYTRDGNVVLGHNTMMGYGDAPPSLIIDIQPAHGHRVLMQGCPGWIHSGTDFFITDAGLVGSETTIGGFEGFDSAQIPEFVRMRRATQDASSIEEWCEIMKKGNNGGYANAWLLGDIHSKQIACLELGLKRVSFEKKADGYYTGSNVAEDIPLLRLETSAHETDIRESSVARRVRWKELMRKSAGKIDLALAKRFEADHYDEFYHKDRAGSRSLCGHFELDPVPGGPWPGVPFGCAGTVDAKVVDAALAAQMSFAARWGSACGAAFDAHKFLADHPQFEWLTTLLKSRPSEPWVVFAAGEKR